MGRIVTFCRCGTEESWKRHRENGEYAGMNLVVPGTVYVSETGICLVTSQEWVDWLTGETEDIPISKECLGDNYET